MTKGDGAASPPGAKSGAPDRGAAAPKAGTSGATRRSHVPGAGTAAAEAVEKARREMLHEGTRARQDAAERRQQRARIGADVVVEAILRQGVDVLFGYPGGVILPLYDVLGDHPELRHVLVRHEQGAAHAAEGFARATGKVGVCLATSGPAATNLVTGLANAQLDSIPIVAITGNVPAALLGKDAFQEIDITGITLPMTKHNYLVRDADDLPRVLAEAFYIARTGRPGPVHVDITKDALQQETDAAHPTDEEVAAGLPGFRPTLGGHPRQLKLIAEEIAKAKRPVILAGHGILIADATEELRLLAEKARIPVAWTLLGIGAMDETHPLAYGYMGMHGWKHVNRAIQAADLLVAIGMRFDDRVTGNVRTYAPYARIVHVDIDPAEIGKNVAVEVPVVGDAKRVLGGLLPLVHEVPEADRAPYLAQLAEWRRESEESSWHGSGAWRDGLLSADFVIAQIGEATGHDATMVADVGQNQMWMARYAGYRRPNSHLSSGGLGTMGYAVPTAMGAALGRPDKATWAVCGDGGFQMTIQELATLVQDNIPVRIALMDNKKLGMIRQWQELFYAGNYQSSHLLGPDYLKLADAYGIPAWKVRTPEEVLPAIEAANAVDGPALVWFEIAEAQNVFPIMPAGKGLSDLIETWGGADE
jgi:acetolactate synthase-1/2/3 large subunit